MFASGDDIHLASHDATFSLAAVNTTTVLSTVFIPKTRGVERLVQNNTDDVSRAFTIIPRSFARNTTAESTVSRNVATINDIYNLYDDNSNMVLIVGVTCGVVGLLLGIALMALIWIYKVRNQRRNNFARGRQASVAEKNPREMTFEPLDLSLTLPRYNQSISTSTYHQETFGTSRVVSPSSVIETCRSEDDSSHDYEPTVSASTYHSHEEIDDQTGYLSSRYLSKEEVATHGRLSPRFKRRISLDPKLEWEKRAASTSARGSLSSGLGTATESDIYPFESRNTFLPVSESINENLPTFCNEIPPYKKAVTPRKLEKTSNSTNVMEVVRESDKRRFKGSFPEKRKKRPARKSNASSSSGTKSSDDFPLPKLSSSTPNSEPTLITRSEKRRCSDRSGDSETRVEDAIKQEINEIGSNENTDANPPATELEEQTTQLEVVSTYFNLHFPPTSLISKQQAATGSANELIVDKDDLDDRIEL